MEVISMISTGKVDEPLFLHTDEDGDGIAVYPSMSSENGPGVYLRTSREGCSVPAERLEEFVKACRTAVQKAAESY